MSLGAQHGVEVTLVLNALHLFKSASQDLFTLNFGHIHETISCIRQATLTCTGVTHRSRSSSSLYLPSSGYGFTSSSSSSLSGPRSSGLSSESFLIVEYLSTCWPIVTRAPSTHTRVCVACSLCHPAFAYASCPWSLQQEEAVRHQYQSPPSPTCWINCARV
jgi:hypothetical protein